MEREEGILSKNNSAPSRVANALRTKVNVEGKRNG